MKALHKIISSVKPHFEEGGKLAKFWVVFDSLETYLTMVLILISVLMKVDYG